MRGLDPDRVIELLRTPHFQQRSDAMFTSAAWVGQVRMEHFVTDGDAVLKVVTVPKDTHFLIVTVIILRDREEETE